MNDDDDDVMVVVGSRMARHCSTLESLARAQRDNDKIAESIIQQGERLCKSSHSIIIKYWAPAKGMRATTRHGGSKDGGGDGERVKELELTSTECQLNALAQ